MMVTTLLIIHGLIGVALLGALTHQAVSVLRQTRTRTGSFIDRYSSVNQQAFTATVVVLYLIGAILGGAIYPHYRLDVRIPFEEMHLGWAVGLFELKEHFAGIGAGLLPLYVYTWQAGADVRRDRTRRIITLLLAAIVWWDFLVGHVLNNMRGLG